MLKQNSNDESTKRELKLYEIDAYIFVKKPELGFWKREMELTREKRVKRLGFKQNLSHN
jgi:hypothetical protein